MRRLLTLAALVTAGTLTLPATSHAQQSVSFYLGGFVPRDYNARDRDDVLVDNLNFLIFDLGKFHGPTFGGEWLVGLGEKFDAGLGVGFYSQTVNATDAEFTYPDGSEILQELKLRIVPFTATIRWLPLGHSDAFEPYIGGGVGVLAFRYEETGDFVDEDRNIYHDTFRATGAATGPLFLAGARFPISRTMSIGGEYRYQWATGDLPADQFFVPKIDLGGFSYLGTLKVRF